MSANAFDLAVHTMAGRERVFLDITASEYVDLNVVEDLCFKRGEVGEALVNISPVEKRRMGTALVNKDDAELGRLIRNLLTEYTERVVADLAQQRQW